MNVRELGRRVFADRLGFTLFLASLALYGLIWRVDIFIVDTFTIVNTLAAVVDGQLHISNPAFGPALADTPGMVIVDGYLYGRNYGQVILSLPAYGLLTALSLVTDLRVAVVGGWSLLVLAVFQQVGHLTDRRRQFVLAGSVVAVVLFFVNLIGATKLPTELIPLLALQVTSMVAAALVPVVCYRFASLFTTPRTASTVGVAAIVLVPIAFWAPIPKRHAFTALLALTTLWLFAASRMASNSLHARHLRALSYVPVGLTAWIHAPEALVLCVILVPFDFLTARSNTREDVLVVACAFALSLVPFFLTNLAISGNPVAPPRLLPGYTEGDTVVSFTQNASNGGQHAAGGAPDSAPAAGGLLVKLLHPAVVFLNLVVRGVTTVFDPTRLYHVFIRSGTIPTVDYSQTGQETVEMTILEAAPILAALAGAPVALARSNRSLARLREPFVQTALFGCAYIGLFTMLYLPRLPLHSTITVRYLAPIVPVLFIFVAAVPAVRRVLAAHRVEVLAVAAGFALATCVFVVFAFAGGVSPGTAVQTHALLNLGVAFLLGGWSVLATARGGYERTGVVVLGLAIGAMAALLVLSGLDFFGVERHFALPLSQTLSDLLPTTKP
ncbi:hypothetical protein [Haladaptatus sp. CMSO5]|uniref:hypothetical protein n=1 Tax=Haladaptatus sp. CMSO5 TaxID=3120514 RepID=UPI002FCE4118